MVYVRLAHGRALDGDSGHCTRGTLLADCSKVFFASETFLPTWLCKRLEPLVAGDDSTPQGGAQHEHAARARSWPTASSPPRQNLAPGGRHRTG